MRLAVYSPSQGAKGREVRDFHPDVMKRLESVEFVDATEGDDVVTLTFDNRDLAMFDDPDLRFDRNFVLTFGWTGGEVSQRRVCKVEKRKNEGDRLKIVAHPDHGFVDRGFLFMSFQRGLEVSIPPPAPETVLIPSITEDPFGRPRLETIEQTALRGGTFGANRPNMPDKDFFLFIARTVAIENGFLARDVIFLGSLPDHIPEFTPAGWIITRGDLTEDKSPGALTWHFVMDVLAGMIDWHFRIDNGLLIFQPNDFADDPAVELVYRGMLGRYESEFTREIFEGSLSVETDIFRLPSVVHARGFDITGKNVWLAIANDVNTRRQARVMSKGAVNLQKTNPEIRHITTNATTEERALEDADAELRNSEKDQTKISCKVLGLPRIVAGTNVLVTLPSRTIQGVYTITEAIHKILQPSQIYTTEYQMERRIHERPMLPDEQDVPTAEEQKTFAELFPLDLSSGKYYYYRHLDKELEGQEEAPGDVDTPPQKQIPQR